MHTNPRTHKLKPLPRLSHEELMNLFGVAGAALFNAFGPLISLSCFQVVNFLKQKKTTCNLCEYSVAPPRWRRQPLRITPNQTLGESYKN